VTSPDLGFAASSLAFGIGRMVSWQRRSRQPLLMSAAGAIVRNRVAVDAPVQQRGVHSRLVRGVDEGSLLRVLSRVCCLWASKAKGGGIWCVRGAGDPSMCEANAPAECRSCHATGPWRISRNWRPARA
jgi:hypothetical protein